MFHVKIVIFHSYVKLPEGINSHVMWMLNIYVNMENIGGHHWRMMVDWLSQGDGTIRLDIINITMIHEHGILLLTNQFSIGDDTWFWPRLVWVLSDSLLWESSTLLA